MDGPSTSAAGVDDNEGVPAIDPGTILPNLMFGVLAVAAGIPIVINRRPLFERVARERSWNAPRTTD
jgi:hypothetical protein